MAAPSGPSHAVAGNASPTGEGLCAEEGFTGGSPKYLQFGAGWPLRPAHEARMERLARLRRANASGEGTAPCGRCM